MNTTEIQNTKHQHTATLSILSQNTPGLADGLKKLGIDADIINRDRTTKIKSLSHALILHEGKLNLKKFKKYNCGDYLNSVRYINLFMLYTNQTRIFERIQMVSFIRSGLVGTSLVTNAIDEFPIFQKGMSIAELIEKEIPTQPSLWKALIEDFRLNTNNLLTTNLDPIQQRGIIDSIERAFIILRHLYK